MSSVDPFTAVLGDARGSGREDIWTPPAGWLGEDPRWWSPLHGYPLAYRVAAALDDVFAAGNRLIVLTLNEQNEYEVEVWPGDNWALAIGPPEHRDSVTVRCHDRLYDCCPEALRISLGSTTRLRLW